jgi:hypothetical protein
VQFSGLFVNQAFFLPNIPIVAPTAIERIPGL